MSTVVVSSWLVPSMSRTTATISSSTNSRAPSTRVRMASLIEEELTQNKGTSTRRTRIPFTGWRSGWLRMPPHPAFSPGIRPMTSTSTRLDR